MFPALGRSPALGWFAGEREWDDAGAGPSGAGSGAGFAWSPPPWNERSSARVMLKLLQLDHRKLI